jgi:protein-tyrosine phosphatase
MIPRIKQWFSGESSRSPGVAAGQTRILMVCTGNICRSPTAEGVLRKKLEQAGLHTAFAVASAGTQGYHTAEPPDPRAVKAAAARGYDISRLKARPMRPEDFAEHQWVLAMDRGHLEWLRKRAPAGAPARVSLLMPFASRHPGLDEVPDPYYGGPEGFERVLDLVEDACDGVVARLREGQPLLRTPA